MVFNKRGFIMCWTVSNIVADTRAKAVKADILFQMSGDKVLLYPTAHYRLFS